MFDYNDDINKIEGWLSEKEASLLYDKAKQILNDKVIVEIGSWKGRSTVCLGQGSKDSNKVKVYTIDPHYTDPDWEKKHGKTNTLSDLTNNLNERSLSGVVEVVVSTSNGFYNGFNKPIGLLFIDGDHSFKGAYSDLSKWSNKVVEGGLIAMHDTIITIGVVIASFCYILFSGKCKNPRVIDSITIFENSKNEGIYDLLRNFVFIVLRFTLGSARFFISRVKEKGNGPI